MAIPEDKVRLITTLPEKLKSDFELLCELDKRSASKQLEYILEYYIKNVETRVTKEKYDEYYKDIYLRERLIEKIYTFFTRKNGEYLGRIITVEYFFEVFKDETIDDDIIKDIINIFSKTNEQLVEFFLKCMKHYTSNKKD